MFLLAVTYLSTYYDADGVRAADLLMSRLGSLAHALPLDIKFLAFARERAARDMGAHVLDRAALDALERDMRTHHLHALYLVRDVWELVRTAARPDQVSAAVGRLAVHAHGASTTYAKLIERNPRDKNLLRSYAQFLTYIDANTDKAAQVLEEAENVEYAETCQNQKPLPTTGSRSDSDQNLLATRAVPELVSSLAEHDREAPLNAKVLGTSTPMGNNNNKIAFSAQDTEFTSDAIGHLGKVGKLGSDTSGTSASKMQRQKQMLRLTVTERVLQPLHATQPMYFAVLAIFAACIIGFIVCRELFATTVTTLTVVFDDARQTRFQAANIIDYVRGIVYANMISERDLFNQNYAGLAAAVQDMVSSKLPGVLASQAALTVPPSTFRMYQSYQLTGVYDFTAVTLNGLQTAQWVVLAGKLALGYSYGALMPEVCSAISSIRFLTDNLAAIFQALATLPDSGIVAYMQLLNGSQGLLYGTMICTLVALLAAIVYADQMIIGKYFETESQLTRLLLSVPRSTASHIVTNLEEELEAFREVTDVDSLTLEQHRLAAINGRGDQGKPHMKGRRWYRLAMSITFVLIASVTAGMYAATLSLVNQQSNMHVVVLSGTRRYLITALNIFSREYISPDWTISPETCIKNNRGALLDLATTHSTLVNDVDGLSFLFPSLTVYPRDCTAIGSCGNMTEIPAIGFTRQVAGQSANAELDQFIYESTLFVNSMTLGDTTSGNISNATDPRYIRWKLMAALGNDVMNRVDEVNGAMLALILTQVTSLSTLTMAAFAVQVVLVLVAVGAFVSVGLPRVRIEGKTLTAMLYLIPEPLMIKEVPRIHKFVESGGLIVDLNGLAVGGGGVIDGKAKA
ncbi:hypothetical protein BC828DRAFT_387806 [Blastocladiella britannica]|nr:hypothetical protein BC828DRAFT_387806 [Blastocladiella britannica]